MDGEMLKKYGIDYEQGLGRCLGDATFYSKLLELFLEDGAFARIQRAYADGNRKLMFESAHELKGVCGNVGMTELLRADCALVELLRHGGGSPERITEAYENCRQAYDKTVEGVRRALGK